MSSTRTRESRLLLILIVLSLLGSAGAREWRASREAEVVRHADRLLTDLDRLKSDIGTRLDSLRGAHAP